MAVIAPNHSAQVPGLEFPVLRYQRSGAVSALLVGSSNSQRQDGQTADSAQHDEFLDMLMPFYAKALAYAQTLTGSLMDGEDLVSDAVLGAYGRFHQLRNRRNRVRPCPSA